MSLSKFAKQIKEAAESGKLEVHGQLNKDACALAYSNDQLFCVALHGSENDPNASAITDEITGAQCIVLYPGKTQVIKIEAPSEKNGSRYHIYMTLEEPSKKSPFRYSIMIDDASDGDASILRYEMTHAKSPESTYVFDFKTKKWMLSTWASLNCIDNMKSLADHTVMIDQRVTHESKKYPGSWNSIWERNSIVSFLFGGDRAKHAAKKIWPGLTVEPTANTSLQDPNETGKPNLLLVQKAEENVPVQQQDVPGPQQEVPGPYANTKPLAALEPTHEPSPKLSPNAQPTQLESVIKQQVVPQQVEANIGSQVPKLLDIMPHRMQYVGMNEHAIPTPNRGVKIPVYKYPNYEAIESKINTGLNKENPKTNRPPTRNKVRPATQKQDEKKKIPK